MPKFVKKMLLSFLALLLILTSCNSQSMASSDNASPIILPIPQEVSQASQPPVVSSPLDSKTFDKLIFDDEFNYKGAIDSKWKVETGDGANFGNQESEYYTNSIKNCFVSGGNLHIKAIKEDANNNKNHYTSARINTSDSFSFTYGKVDVRAKLPKGGGSWPAIWMLSSNINSDPWPHCGEVDIMEEIGNDFGVIHSSMHCQDYYYATTIQRTATLPVTNVDTAFHVYSCTWRPNSIEFFVDDVSVKKFFNGENGMDTDQNGWPFNQNFFLILNLAVGGTFGGNIDDTAFPYEMQVDYVHVYQ